MKNLLLKRYNATIWQITLQASSNNVDAKLLKSSPQTNNGVPRGIPRLAYKYIGNLFKDLLLQNYNTTFCEITMQASSYNVYSKLHDKTVNLGLKLGSQEGFKI